MLFTAFGLVSSTSATTNPVEVDGNASTCAQVGASGSIQYDGNLTSSVVSVNGLFTVTVTENKFVTITSVVPGVTFQVVIIKAGNGYYAYNPPVANMRAPLVGNDQNIPALSHWFACYKYDPPVTTTTAAATTTTAAATTTTAAATTTTAAATTTTAAATTTTAAATTTTIVVTTTTEQASEAATTTTAPTTTAPTTTTTLFAGLGPVPTTTVGRALPVTGNGEASSEMLLLGFLLMGFGSVVVLLSRRPIES